MVVLRIIFLLCCSLLGATSLAGQSGQVSIINLALSSMSVNGSLGKLTLVNHQALPLSVYLEGSIRPERGAAYRDRSDLISLQPGMQTLDLSGLEWADPRLLRDGSELQVGSFEICVEVYDIDNGLLASSCQSVFLQPRTPPYLIYPFDKEELETLLPVFTWTPPAPIDPMTGVFYHLRIVELRDLANSIVALRNFPAFFSRDDLSQTVMPYLVASRPFETDKHYAWQIEAFSNGQSLGRSEIWTFRFKVPQKQVKELDERGFVELNTKAMAGYYMARGQIKIRFDQRYGEQLLDVHIYDENHQEHPFSQSQVEQVGDNRFILSLPPGSGYKQDELYTLEVKDGKGKRYQLRFKYFPE